MAHRKLRQKLVLAECARDLRAEAGSENFQAALKSSIKFSHVEVMRTLVVLMHPFHQCLKCGGNQIVKVLLHLFHIIFQMWR